MAKARKTDEQKLNEIRTESEQEQEQEELKDKASELPQQDEQKGADSKLEQENQHLPTVSSSTKTDEQASSQSLISLEELAQQFRVPGWQHAALCKLMGWQPGKMVSLAEYETGLTALSGRRLGSSGR